jgi:prefoldin beta subunit
LTINYESLNEETKKRFQTLSQFGQTLEILTQQKLQIDSNIRETELAIESLTEATPDTPVYKSIGGVMVKSTRDKLLDEKNTNKETLTMQSKTLKETLTMQSKTLAQKIERTKSTFESMQKSLQEDLQNQ